MPQERAGQRAAGPTWISANDLQTPGQWYWSSATSDDDVLFWTGAADGTEQNNLFSYWASGAPGSGSCAFMKGAKADGGQWSDGDCTQRLAYICSYLRDVPVRAALRNTTVGPAATIEMARG